MVNTAKQNKNITVGWSVLMIVIYGFLLAMVAAVVNCSFSSFPASVHDLVVQDASKLPLS